MQNLSFGDNMFTYGDRYGYAMSITITFLNLSYMYTAHKYKKDEEECLNKPHHTRVENQLPKNGDVRIKSLYTFTN